MFCFLLGISYFNSTLRSMEHLKLIFVYGRNEGLFGVFLPFMDYLHVLGRFVEKTIYNHTSGALSQFSSFN